jgi:hypothetical protein
MIRVEPCWRFVLSRSAGQQAIVTFRIYEGGKGECEFSTRRLRAELLILLMQLGQPQTPICVVARETKAAVVDR